MSELHKSFDISNQRLRPLDSDQSMKVSVKNSLPK